MAQRKSGPVKPPVIDLKAREAEPAASTAEARAAEAVAEAEQDAAPVEEPQRAPPPPPPRPPARLAMPWSAISIAAVGGALLGAGLVYGLGNWLPLPGVVPIIADPAARLDAQDASFVAIDGRLVALEEQTRRTQVSLDATIAQLDGGLTEVRNRLDETRQQIAALPTPSPSADLAPIEAELASLSDRITAIGAGASSADAAALAETISTIEAGIAALRTEMTDNAGKVGAIDASIAALQQDVATLKGAASSAGTSAAGVADIGPAVRLPLVVSGLESAVINGRPFAAELSSLRTLLPDLAVPAEIESAAEAGLARPDAVAAQFNAAVPEILAGRAATGTGDIGADALEWMKGLLALRPSGEVAGDTPEAIVSQLEAAVGRRDFAAAAQLLAALPPAMQAGAGEAGRDIVALAAADEFLTDLRARALAPAAEATP